jgi:hypothetical protein
MKLLGIHGKKRSGKDTVAGMVKARCFGEVQTIAFGDAMKKIASVAYGIPLPLFYDDDKKEQKFYKDFPSGPGMSPRLACTTMHDALTPVLGEGIFIGPVRKVWEECLDKDILLIITDVRFSWEEEFIISEGGTIICVERDATDGLAGTHASEVGLTGNYTNHVIKNNGSLADLDAQVVKFLQTWSGPDWPFP